MTYYGIDEAYDQLSEIAPTTAYQEGRWSTPGSRSPAQVGEALDRTDEAAALVDEVEGSLAETAAGDPAAEGKSFTFGFVTPDSVMALRDPDDVMMAVPAGLGMTLSPAVLDLPEGDSFAVPVSLEAVDALDADVPALLEAARM